MFGLFEPLDSLVGFQSPLRHSSLCVFCRFSEALMAASCSGELRCPSPTQSCQWLFRILIAAVRRADGHSAASNLIRCPYQYAVCRNISCPNNSSSSPLNFESQISKTAPSGQRPKWKRLDPLTASNDMFSSRMSIA